jgi:hypothetical protein
MLLVLMVLAALCCCHPHRLQIVTQLLLCRSGMNCHLACKQF